MMNKLNLRRTISPEFTAEDWDLYTNSSFSSETMNVVAESLNIELANLVNKNNSRYEVELGMSRLMSQFSKYGANDSEPHQLLERVLDAIFPKTW